MVMEIFLGAVADDSALNQIDDILGDIAGMIAYSFDMAGNAA